MVYDSILKCSKAAWRLYRAYQNAYLLQFQQYRRDILGLSALQTKKKKTLKIEGSYEQLNLIQKNLPKVQTVIIMGDFNAEVGSDNTDMF